eukprot:4966641-Pyramimonas_sp.AAC.1
MAASRSTSQATWAINSGLTMAMPQSFVIPENIADSSKSACWRGAEPPALPMPFAPGPCAAKKSTRH